MDTFEYPGQLDISKIVITAANGNVLDITPQVAEIDIFESVFNNTLSASITMIDAAAIISKLPIIGYEKIEFTIQTPAQAKRTLEFYVYKVSDRIKWNNSEAYVLKLVSYEFVLDQITSKSRSYSGTCDAIVKQIFKENFPASTKTIELRGSLGKISFINPYWSPMQAINWVANRAIPSTGSGVPSFFFYETLDGYKFRSLESMFAEKATFEYVKRPTNMKTRQSLLNKMKTIVDYKIKEFGSSLELTSNGAFGARLITKDINLNSYSTATFSYDQFNGFKKLNENPIKPKTNAFMDSLQTPSSTKFIGTTSDASVAADDNNFGTWVLPRKSIIEQMSATNIEILVPGNVGIQSGVCVDLVIPASYQEKTLDKFVSGKYVVMSVRHIINNSSKHMMALQLSKESFASEQHLTTMAGSL